MILELGREVGADEFSKLKFFNIPEPFLTVPISTGPKERYERRFPFR